MIFGCVNAKLSQQFWTVLELFNDALGSDISQDNTVLAFFTPANGITMYESFCERYFPKSLAEKYKVKGYFEGFAAQAFVEGDLNGVLIRSDPPFADEEWDRIFLHEISHIYCTRNEIEGGCFFDRFCMGEGLADGAINSGYAIWREAIADIMADTVANEYTQFNIWDIQDNVQYLYDQMEIENPDSKKIMSVILSQIMLCHEVAGTEQWEEAEAAIKDALFFPESNMMDLLKLVFDNLHRDPFWKISVEFIMDLGDLYMAVLTRKRFRGI